jgi:Dimethlysulfonioproprionate lyase
MTGRGEFERMSKSLSRDDRRGRSTTPPLAELLAPLVNLLRQLLETAGAEAEAFIRDWPRELVARPVVARSLPVVAALPGLSRFAAPGTRALVDGIAALAGELDWRQTYTEADFGQRFLDNYGWSEWIGERGAFVSDAIACGVLLLGPDTEYPAHSHEAEELYLPLAGCALWRAGASDWRLRAPGERIHHPSWTVHAMRTAREPLLAAFIWRAGDLSAKSRIVLPSPVREKGTRIERRGKQANRAVEWQTRFSP